VRGAALVGSVAFLLGALSPVPAHAQVPATAPSGEVVTPAGSDVATAVELFRQGRAAFEARDFPTARARLLESAKLNPRVGTFVSLAECEEALGLLASARAHWQQAADLATAQGDGRADFARQHLASIDPRVPRMTLLLPGDAPAGTTIRVDDVELGTASVGLAIPMEVGAHVLVVVAPGFEPARQEVDLGEAQNQQVTLSLGRPVPAAAPVPIRVQAPAPETASLPTRPTSDAGPPRDHRVMRAASYAVAGAGLVGIGVGSYLGIRAIGGKNVAGCTGNACNESGMRLRNDAIADGNAATWVFVGGGALVATGAVLWLFSGNAAARSAIEWIPSVDGRHVGAAARWTW
jgi:hypothetical protein